MKTFDNMSLIQWAFFVVGLITASMLGFFVELIVKRTKSSISISPPTGMDKNTWEAITDTKTESSSKLLGLLERIFIFVSLWIEVPQLIFAWLAFKLASKWQTWATIVKVPENIDKLIDPIDFFRVRHHWGTRVLQVWLIGTLANVLAGFLAYLLAILLLRLV